MRIVALWNVYAVLQSQLDANVTITEAAVEIDLHPDSEITDDPGIEDVLVDGL